MVDDPRPEDMPELRSESLGAHLARIVELGNRFPGSPGEERCRELLLDEFRRAGLANIRAEEFCYLSYEPVASSCTLLPEGLALPCTALQTTADAVVEGEAVYAAAGLPEDVEALARRGVDLRGKVVVVRTFHPFYVGPSLIGHGIAALVNVSEVPDGLIAHFTARHYPPPLEPPFEGYVLPFPGVTVEAAAAQRLLSLMSAGPVRLRVEHRARYFEATGANVLGEIVGEREPERRVVVGGHYDTQLEGPGAADNGTGVAAVLELAHRWSSLRPRRTVVLAAWGEEEPASWGALAYARANRQGTVAMVNLDAMGVTSPGTRTIVADDSFAAFARESALRAGWDPEAELDGSLYPGGDYSPFLDAGIPACFYWRYPPQHPYYHSAGDVLRYVSLDHVLDVTAVSAYTAFRLASMPEPGLGPAHPTRSWADLSG